MEREDYNAAELLAMEMRWPDAVKFLRDESDQGLINAIKWAEKIARQNPDCLMAKTRIIPER